MGNKALDNKEFDKETLEGVIEGLFKGFQKDLFSKFGEGIDTDGIKEVLKNDKEAIQFLRSYNKEKASLNLFIKELYPSGKRDNYKINNLFFAYLSGTFSDMLRRYIDRYEGSACSADKEHYVMGAIVKSFLLQKDILLDGRSEGKPYKRYYLPNSFNSILEIANWYEAHHTFNFEMIKDAEMLAANNRLKERKILVKYAKDKAEE
jgi:predicted CopG family antitoxin